MFLFDCDDSDTGRINFDADSVFCVCILTSTGSSMLIFDFCSALTFLYDKPVKQLW
jgi:hypothetical protein